MRHEIHLYLHGTEDPKVTVKLDQILAALGVIKTQEATQMADLAALEAEVAENGDAVASAVALLGSLAQAVRDAGTDPAALESLANQLDANTAALAEAVVANTPAAG